MSQANQFESIFLLETHSSKSPSHEKNKRISFEGLWGMDGRIFYRNLILIGLILINFLNGIAMVDCSNLKIKNVFWTDA